MTSPSSRLRPYQEEALRISKEKWERGVTRQLLALPTGTGKTHVFASLPKHHRINGRMLVLTHLKELNKQAAKKIQQLNPGLRVGVEMGMHTSSPWDKVVVTSVPSISRRLSNFRRQDFDVIVCDEAHHSTAKSYRSIFEHFGLFSPTNKRLLLGVTATPFRTDGEALQNIYRELIYRMTLLQAMQRGWITDLIPLHVTTSTSLDSVHSRCGDFVEGELAKAIDSPVRNALVARYWKDLGENRRTIVFTVDINHAKHMAQMFQSCGVEADWVSGRDSDLRREQIIRDHKAGRLKVLCNCAVVSEGYDDPGVECIVMARPTLSRLLFVQVIGRGLRLQEGIDNLVAAREQGVPIRKSNCLVIDVVDNTLNHNLVTTQSIFLGVQLRYGSSVLAVVAQNSLSKDDHNELSRIQPPNTDGIEMHAEEVDLFGGWKPRPFWQQGASGAELLSFMNGYARIQQDMPGQWHVEGRVGEIVEFRRERLGKSVAKRLAEEWASKLDPGVTRRFRGTVSSSNERNARIRDEGGESILVNRQALYESHLNTLRTGDVVDFSVKQGTHGPEAEKLAKVAWSGPTGRAEFPGTPMTIPRGTTRPKVSERQKARCPFCKQRLFVDRLQRHMKTRCTKRPQSPRR